MKAEHLATSSILSQPNLPHRPAFIHPLFPSNPLSFFKKSSSPALQILRPAAALSSPLPRHQFLGSISRNPSISRFLNLNFWVRFHHRRRPPKNTLVQTMLFVQGINTLVQTLFGTRLPAVIGGSYAYMVPIVSIINDPSLAGIESPSLRFRNTMKAVQGSMIVASSIQVILGYSQLWAICSRFFSPLAMVPVIALAGFGLFDRGFPWLVHHQRWPRG
ncbi:hypothetical protein Droror1_Dr00015155 [Drosera rotundifolia]